MEMLRVSRKLILELAVKRAAPGRNGCLERAVLSHVVDAPGDGARTQQRVLHTRWTHLTSE